MGTEIEITDTTKRLLDQLKQQFERSSYDAVVHELVCRAFKVPPSLAGPVAELTEDRGSKRVVENAMGF